MNKLTLNFRNLAMVTALGAMTFMACSRENIVPGMDSNQSVMLAAPTPEEHAADLYQTMLEPVAQHATMDVDFSLENDGIADDLRRDAFDARTPGSKNPCQMNPLSDRQIAALRNARAQFERCVKAAEYKLRELNRQYVARAEAARKDLMEAYRNGRISREELARRLNQLNENIRKNMANDTNRADLLEQIKSCHETYMKAVQSILTPAQWRVWSNCQKNQRGR